MHIFPPASSWIQKQVYKEQNVTITFTWRVLHSWCVDFHPNIHSLVALTPMVERWSTPCLKFRNTTLRHIQAFSVVYSPSQ